MVTLQTTLQDPVTSTPYTGWVTITPFPQQPILLSSELTSTARHKRLDVTGGQLSVDLEPGTYQIRWAEAEAVLIEVDAEMSGVVTMTDVAYDGFVNLPTPSDGVPPHEHDDLYYREAEVDLLLGGKADSDHNHDGTYDPAGAASGVQSNLDTHEGDTGNPHGVTKAQVGLANVDNTADANKPVSGPQQAALDGKSDAGHAHPGVYDPANTAASLLAAHAAGAGVHPISGIDGLQAALDAKAATVIPVSSLPASPVVGQIYRLTETDSSKRAPIGLYLATVSGWTCLAPENYWEDFSWSTTAMAVVPNTRHFVAIPSAKPSWSVTFTAPGSVLIVVNNVSEAVIGIPLINGTFPALLFSGAWDDAALDLATLYLEWDGTIGWVAAKQSSPL